MMNHRFEIHEFAIQEAKEAYDYYEKQQAGLGERFLNEVQKAIESIKENPTSFRKIKKDFRQFVISTFPYVLIFKIQNDIILLQCIFHTSRNPKHKFRK